MNQEELYKDLVSVPAVDINNTVRTIELDGPFHDFVELFIEVERSETLKNKQNPDRNDIIDLVKLGTELRVPMSFWWFGGNERRINVISLEGNESVIKGVLEPSDNGFVEIPLVNLSPEEIFADIAEMEGALNSMYTSHRRGRINLEELALELELW